MRKTLTWQLGVIIVGMIIASLLISSFATYKTAYERIYEAAGIEAYGCANITTGLLDPRDIEKLLQMDGDAAKKVGEALNWTVNHKNIFETQYLLTPDGKLIALDKNLQAKGYKPGDSFPIDQAAIKELLDMRHPTYSSIYEHDGIKRLSGYAPIFRDHDSSKEIVAISVIDFNADIVTARTWDVVSGGMMLGFIPIVLVSFLTVMLLRKRTKPISALIEQARQIANGNLAVQPVSVKSKDEIGDLAQTLQVMTENLRSMVSVLQTTSEQLAQNAQTTSVSLDEMSVAIQEVSERMEEIASESTDGTKGASEANNALVQLAEMIQSAKEAATASVENSRYTMSAAQQGKGKVTELANRMAEIKLATQETEASIMSLNTFTTEIQSINETISAIAAQTNLLALNASIEAARAGEHGRGFAVVAENVRKLAEQSNKEVAQVDGLIGKIMQSIADTVQSVRESHKSVEEGEHTVTDTASALEQIWGAIDSTVKEINQISALTNEEAAVSERIVQLIQNLNTSIEHMAANTVEVSAAAQQTSASVDEVAGLSTETSKMAQQLRTIVNQFTLS
ncbi:methyl-accepting chemotaxis protein [Brevibacillus migulae]|uniref:methyl-accepting chemotaxis protein n=1 Tax=Brevibacillus migulae TaxID=1644114 RepID=UPI00106E870C|nr:HAMP domain-containing methyl-accepting chemotaxis protein [Brevibacillus migulae]